MKDDRYGLLPLHCAAEEASAELVSAPLQVYPEGAGFQDRPRRLPLHSATACCRLTSPRNPCHFDMSDGGGDSAPICLC